MGDREKVALIASAAVMAVFMVSMTVVQNAKTAKSEPKVNLLADISNVSLPTTDASVVDPGSTSSIKSDVKIAPLALSNVAKASSAVTIALPIAPTPVPIPTPIPKPKVATTAIETTTITAIATTTQPSSTPIPLKNPPALSAVARTLPYSIGTFGNGFASGDGWIDSAGAVSEKNGTLAVGAGTSTTNGIALLNKSDNWSNYTFQANVDWPKGEVFGLIADYMDPKNFLLCDFDEPEPGTVHMSFRKYVDGEVTHLANGNVNNYEQMGGVGITVSIGVKDDTGNCSFNGHQISMFDAAAAKDPPRKGGIGFTTWDPQENNAEIIVHSIGVSNGLFNLGS